jgi:hypothetical protein
VKWPDRSLAEVSHSRLVKTTSIYLASDAQRQEDVIARRERGWLILDEDLDAA